MLKCSNCKLEKQECEFNEDKNSKRKYSYYCKLCSTEKARLYRLENLDRVKEKKKEYYDRIKYTESYIRNTKEYLDKTKQKRKYKDTEWAAKNRERSREIKRKWKKNNKGLSHSYTVLRRLRIKNSCIKSLTKEDIDFIKVYYIVADLLSNTTKIKYVVDHIVPLQGENVCGLHVPWNLRLMENTDNIKKSNKFIEELSNDLSAE